MMKCRRRKRGEKAVITLKFPTIPAICTRVFFVIYDFAIAHDKVNELFKYSLCVCVYYMAYGLCAAMGLTM